MTANFKRNVASHEDVIAIYEELRHALRTTGEKIVEYVDGASDQTVAAKLNVGVSSVISIRQKRFGTFYMRGDVPPGGSAISLLRNELAIMRCELDELRGKYNRLIETLVLPPHNVACRHLKVIHDKPPATQA